MANYCGNRLVIIGGKRSVKAVCAFLTDASFVREGVCFTQRVMDLNKIIPIPSGLPQMTASLTDAQKLGLIAKFGHWNDYAWRKDNWGQSWDLIEVVEEVKPCAVEGWKGFQAIFRFVSNGAPIQPVIEFLSGKFPLVGFLLVFDEGGNDLYGGAAYFDDEQVDEIYFSADELMGDVPVDDEEWYEKREERAVGRMEEVEFHLLDRLRLDTALRGFSRGKKKAVKRDEQGSFEIPLPAGFEVMLEQ